MRPRSNGNRFSIVFILIVAFLVATPAWAQESRWKELDAQVEQLQKQGKNKEALPVAEEALHVAEATFGAEHPNTATALSNLGVTYYTQGKYAEAEPLLKSSLAIREKALGPNHPLVAVSLTYLANLNSDQGEYAAAEPLYKRSEAILEKALGYDHPLVAQSLGNFAALYSSQGRYAEAGPLLERSLVVSEKALGPNHPNVAKVLDSLAFLYEFQHRYAEAESLLKRDLAIFEKNLGPDHIDVAKSLDNLAELYGSQGRYTEAEPLFKRSVAIFEKSLGADHKFVTVPLKDLAELYWAEDKYAEAESFFERDLQNLSRQFEYSFSYMSEKDRLEFLEQAESTFPQYFSFCFAYAQKDPALTSKMYDVLLWEKGLVGSSIATLQARVAATGDTQTLKLFEELAAKKNESAGLATSRPEGWRELRSLVDGEANELEQQLARSVSLLAEPKKNLSRANWQDVQKALAPVDAAVEVQKFQFYDGKKWTDDAYYVALVIRSKSRRPALVLLGEAHQIEGKVFSDYRAEMGSRGPNASSVALLAATSPWRSLYDTVWKPLEPSLGDAKRVYVSLDGALNELPLGILQGTDGRRVMEKYDVRVVSSTRDLLRPGHHATSNIAILVDNPRFLLSDEEQRTAVKRLRGSEKQEQATLLTPAALPSTPSAGGFLATGLSAELAIRHRLRAGCCARCRGRRWKCNPSVNYCAGRTGLFRATRESGRSKKW